MQKTFLFVVSLALLALVPQESFARIYTDLGGGWDKMKIGYACGKAGGSPYDNGNGTYGCVKKCGKSGDSGNDWCAVQCNGDKCQGNTPGRVKGPVRRDNFSNLLSSGLKAGERPPPPSAPPGGGILGTVPGFTSQSPSATGTPPPPAAPPGPVLR